MVYRSSLRLVVVVMVVALVVARPAVKQNLQKNNKNYAAGMSGAPAATSDKQDDFILLVKNNDPKKHARNIMIINKHKEDKLRTHSEHKPAAAPGRTAPSPGTKRKSASRGWQSTRTPQERTSSVGEQQTRVERPRDALPPADILDMAPARGYRVNSKRLKGRLCQRHVLVPEGPKYDGSGRAYLPAHGGLRPFARTRRPRLLLPSCCNCCRKSVLGCE